MKTLLDILTLINDETIANNNKAMQVKFDLNTKYNWLSMYKTYDGLDRGDDTIFSNLKIDTVANIQLAYWSAYCAGRSYDTNQIHE